MIKRRRPDPKVQALRSQGTLNAHPENVSDSLFLENEFFDPRDILQVKYEMLRRVRVKQCSLSQSAKAFGFSRPSFYKAQQAFQQGGLPGLIPERRGPRHAHKLSGEVMEFVCRALETEPSLPASTLAQRIQERFGLRVHARSIERALARHQKKRW